MIRMFSDILFEKNPFLAYTACPDGQAVFMYKKRRKNANN